MDCLAFGGAGVYPTIRRTGGAGALTWDELLGKLYRGDGFIFLPVQIKSGAVQLGGGLPVNRGGVWGEQGEDDENGR